MKQARIYAGLGLSIALAGSAQAEGWTVTDFTSLPDRATCMSYAETTFNIYRVRFGGNGFTGRSTWTVGGYDLRGETVDGLFICGDEGGAVAPFLILHNTDDDSEGREAIADRLGDIWDEIVAGNGVPAVSEPATGGSK